MRDRLRIDPFRERTIIPESYLISRRHVTRGTDWEAVALIDPQIRELLDQGFKHFSNYDLDQGEHRLLFERRKAEVGEGNYRLSKAYGPQGKLILGNEVGLWVRKDESSLNSGDVSAEGDETVLDEQPFDLRGPHIHRSHFGDDRSLFQMSPEEIAEMGRWLDEYFARLQARGALAVGGMGAFIPVDPDQESRPGGESPYAGYSPVVGDADAGFGLEEVLRRRMVEMTGPAAKQPTWTLVGKDANVFDIVPVKAEGKKTDPASLVPAQRLAEYTEELAGLLRELEARVIGKLSTDRLDAMIDQALNMLEVRAEQRSILGDDLCNLRAA